MKKYKHIDTTQPVTLEVSTPELPNFTIEGSFEDVAPIHEELGRQFAKMPKPKRRASRAAIVVAHVRQTTITRWKDDLRAGLYDAQNGTRFLKAVREKRQLEKDLRMAQSLGLLADDVCAKHRTALKDVATVR